MTSIDLWEGDLTELARKEESKDADWPEHYHRFTLYRPIRDLVDQIQKAHIEFHATTGKEPNFVVLGVAQYNTLLWITFQSIGDVTVRGIPCLLKQEYDSFVGVGIRADLKA